ncbi:hypothetical protein V8B97DRAFT_1920239 [Scleroderma yunnanense]
MAEKWDFMYLVSDMHQIQAGLTKKDEMIAAQSEAIMELQEQLGCTQQHISETVNVHEQLTARDSLIAEQGQAQAIQQLKDHLTKAETTMNSKIQKLKDQRDTELAAMAKKYDAVIHQNEKSTGSDPPGSHCGHKIIGALVEENGLNVPAQPAPPSLQSAQPDQPAPPAPLSCVPLSSAIVGIVAEEVYQLLRADLNPVFTSPAHLKKPTKRWTNMKAIELWWEKDNDPNHNENQQHICDLFQEIFDHSTDEQFINHDIPKCKQVNAFTTGSGPGPTELGVHWDLAGPLSMPWNQAVLQVLLDRLAQMQHDKGWTSQRILAGCYCKEVLMHQTCLGEVKALCWKDAISNCCTAKESLCGYKVKSKLSYLRIEQGDAEGVVWKWLSNMVMKLGADGMSSEESDEEDLTPMFHIKRMPWRWELSHELHIIDSQLTDNMSLGPKYAKHIRDLSSPLSSHKAVKGLPKSFYDTDWLTHQPGITSNSPFPWMNITSQ